MKIDSVKIVKRNQRVIDISLERDHTFWISTKTGNDWVLTHNCGMPDVDTDVSDRDRVIAVMQKEFGMSNVVPISNYNVMKLKSLTKDISKFYGISFEEVNVATATVEQDTRKATQKHGEDKNLFVLKFDDAMKHSPSYRAFIEKHPQVAESIKVLFKQPRSLGRHAGGVLVCDDLATKMPLITSKGEPQSPWVEGMEYKHLEKIGNFVKYDILGLETLRLIERTIELILQKEGKKVIISIDDERWEVRENDELITTSGEWVKVSKLRAGDDIEVPLVSKRGSSWKVSSTK
jgi:DNA polymerase III alpha subunit